MGADTTRRDFFGCVYGGGFTFGNLSWRPSYRNALRYVQILARCVFWMSDAARIGVGRFYRIPPLVHSRSTHWACRAIRLHGDPENAPSPHGCTRGRLYTWNICVRPIVTSTKTPIALLSGYLELRYLKYVSFTKTDDGARY